MSSDGTALRHNALVYESKDEYLARAVPFLKAGIEAGEGAVVAETKPGGARRREGPAPPARRVSFLPRRGPPTPPARPRRSRSQACGRSHSAAAPRSSESSSLANSPPTR